MRAAQESEPQPPPTPPTNGGLPSDYIHQARQVFGGLLGLFIACADRWFFPDPSSGFSSNVDEIVLLVSLGLVAGALGVFRSGTTATPLPPSEEKSAPPG